MSFLFETFALPLWFIVFAFGCAAPLWIKWYKIFYKKFIVTGRLQKKIKQVSDLAEDKIDVFKKATDHMSVNVNEKNTTKKSAKGAEMSSADQPYVKIVLKVSFHWFRQCIRETLKMFRQMEKLLLMDL